MSRCHSAQRIGILGGVFDPIHMGHLIVAQEVCQKCGLDKVIFIPCAIPPHKEYSGMASAEARLEMVKLAIEGNPHFEVSTIELERGGVSYTVDTLRQLRGDLGRGAEIYLIIGEDNVPEIHTWCDPEGILDLCTMIVARRPRLKVKDVDERLVRRMKFIITPLIEISSTEIRGRLERGEPIRYMVPDSVLRYIEENGLYTER